MNDATGSVTLCSAETVNAMAEHFATGTRRARVADVTVTNLGDHVITFDTTHINERAGIPQSGKRSWPALAKPCYKFALPLTGWWVSDAT